MSSAFRILALLDDRAGNNAQVLGVAARLGKYDTLSLKYNVLAKLPNALLGATISHVKNNLRSIGAGPLVVISAGRRQAPVAAWIKKNHPQIFACHLMEPGLPYAWFDLVAVPQHDAPPALSNIFPTLLSPHGITPQKLAEAQAQWEPQFAHLPHPRLGVLIGGTSKHATFSAEDYHALSAALAQAGAGSLLITTSRRTDVAGIATIEAALHATSHMLYRYGSAEQNPYLGILACADALVVTGDSISMVSEAVGTGKLVYIFNPARTAAKFERFQRHLYEGAAKPFVTPLDFGWKPPPSPDTATEIASTIKRLFEI